MKTIALVLSAVALALAAPPAWAHVTVMPTEAERGGAATLTFRVPNEAEAANTTKVEIFLPDGVDEVTAEYPGTPGWEFRYLDDGPKMEFSGGKIAPREELNFVIHIRRLPTVGDTLVFKVLQTYDNGEVARWIDVPTGTAEPPHPAPIVRLRGAPPATTTTATTTAPGNEDGSVAPLIVLAALFVAGVGGGIALFSVASRRRSA